jgi:hypothetical protein
MDIIEWFQHDALELPRSRKAGDFATRLKEILDGYLTTSMGLTGSDYITESLKAAMPDITLLCKGLIEAVGYYLDGFPYRAYDRVQDALVSVRPHIDELASLADISDALQFLYRIRLGEPGTISSYSRKDLFHIPFEQVHRVSTQRYSIPGLPSLYLGGSVWVCWEEFGRPDFHRLQLARYRAVSSVQILDFGYRPALIAAAVHANWNTVRQGGKLACFFLAQAICWPILAGCSIKVLSPVLLLCRSIFFRKCYCSGLVAALQSTEYGTFRQKWGSMSTIRVLLRTMYFLREPEPQTGTAPICVNSFSSLTL